MTAESDRLRVGDAVTLPGIAATFEVVGFQGARGLRLRAPSGQLVEADVLAVARLPRRSDHPGPRPAAQGPVNG
jgi:hypothetical protein